MPRQHSVTPLRFKACLTYNGKAYSGFQRQPRKHTIQSVFEDSLHRILREKIVIHSTGRTDKGVHALDQWIHFDVTEEKAIQRVLDSSFLHRLNHVLPDDIKVLKLTKTNSKFHARQNAKSKTYVYWLCFSDKPSPFADDYCWTLKEPDLKAMKQAAKKLIGRHDFSSFCASDSCVKSKVRTLNSIRFIKTKKHPFIEVGQQTFVQIEFKGDGFLKQMVRNIVGTLVDVGQHKTSPSQIKCILQAKDRQKAGPTAPAKGLFLKKVHFS